MKLPLNKKNSPLVTSSIFSYLLRKKESLSTFLLVRPQGLEPWTH